MDIESLSTSCPHETTEDKGGVIVCVDCGLQLDRVLNYENEKRYFSSEDISRNPSRCQVRKTETKNINKDIEHLHLSESITSEVNDLFQEIAEPKNRRSNRRKAILRTCVYSVCKMRDQTYSPEEIDKHFGLRKAESQKGRKIFIEYLKKNKDTTFVKSLIQSSHTKPMQLVPSIFTKLNMKKRNSEHHEEVKKLYERLKNKSDLFRDCRPQSVAAGFVYYYLKSRQHPITRKSFKDLADRSEMTIIKVVKEIKALLTAEGDEIAPTIKI